jgi:formylglycine-generating enzyme required for sulfatase activity
MKKLTLWTLVFSSFVLFLINASLTATETTPPTEKSITNSLDMKFMLIPAGSFMMGSMPDEPERDYGEEKPHKVTITKPFYLQATEVTQGQWQRLMQDNPSAFQYCGEKCPVEKVTWHDAEEFIRRLNMLEGTDKYRLPTEAEWEFACRAGTTTPFSTGLCISTDQANYNGNDPFRGCPKGKNRKGIVRVAKFPPNGWGLYDMHGNVWEWCEDWYGGYSADNVTNPKGPSSGTYRVLRGGSFLNRCEWLRSACRRWHYPGTRAEHIGFRVAKDF